GIFTCIFNGKPNRVYYVGEASNFYDRFIRYFSDQISGLNINYNLTLDQDLVFFIKDEFNEKTVAEINSRNKIYVPQIITKLGQSFDKTFFEKDSFIERRKLIENSSFAFATIEWANDNLLRKEIAGGLISELRKKYQALTRC
ncbi:MAG: hypothetical protein HQK51_04840, partial [Oligoflexia bacterium]|nr:hypothetical protein [Oligoflexia bacterium]